MNAEPILASARQSADLSSLWLAIAEKAPLPMATTEGAGHILRHVNAAFCRLIRRPRDELLGQPFAETMPERNECLTRLDRVYRTGHYESYTEKEQAEPRPVYWSYTMWPLIQHESPVGVVLQVTETGKLHEDMLVMNEALILGSVQQHELAEAANASNARLESEIGQRKKAEEALQRAQALLRSHAGQLEGLVAERTTELTATNKQLEAFIYTIAHDLRAPLRSMQGYSTLLIAGAGSQLDEPRRDFAKRIDESAQFMDALLIDLLEFSRISQEQVELVPVKLQVVVEAVRASLSDEIRDKSAQLDSSGPWPVVLAQKSILNRVLFNLVSNGLKFIAPNTAPRMRLWTEERGAFVRVWLEDNGIGVASDHQDQIFRLFTRLNGEKYPGTGAGLAIVKKGVERMGGRVGVESSPGQGSRFWIELPKIAKPSALLAR